MGLQIGRSVFIKFKSVIMMTTSLALVLGTISFAAPQYFSQAVHAAPGDVSTQAEFETALAGSDTDIALGSSFSTDKQITIGRNVTINGNGHTITPTFAKTDNTNNAVIGIINAGSVAIFNLTIDGVNGTNLHGINAFKSGVTLTSVSLKNNDKYGTVVNGSNVTVNSIATSGNTFGGIDVDQSSTSNAALLTVNGVSSHSESGADLFIDDSTKTVGIADNGSQYNVTNFSNARVYKLKPASTVVTACTTTQSVHTTILSSWDTSRTRANGHNEIVAAGLHVYTDGNSDTGSNGTGGTWNTDKAAGYYTTSFALKNVGDKTIAQSLDYENVPGNMAPGLQMVVDVNNDGTNDGILVGESVYGNNWWLSEGTATSQTGAPVVGGGGSTWNGTINQWLASFPDAQVKAIGYSLGSGAKGDGIIKKISLGCTDYTFGIVLQAPTNLTPSDNSYTNNPSFDNTWKAVPGAAKYRYETTYGSGSYYSDTSDAGNYVLGGSTIIRHNNGSPQATYTWRVQAIDALGNAGPWSEYNHVTVDSIKPTLPVLLTTANDGFETTNNFYFTWTDSADSGSAVHYEFQSSGNNSTDVNGSLVGSWNSIANGNNEQNNLTTPKIHSTGAPDGTYYWQVRAIDAAGNKSDWTAPWKMTIDSAIPDAPQNLTLKDSSNNTITNNGTTKSYEVTASWNGVSDAASYEYKYWNNIATSAYNTEATAYIVNNGLSLTRTGVFNQGEGTHYIQVRTFDAAGNPSAWSNTFTVVYDATAPSVPTLNSPADEAIVNGVLLVNKWNAASGAVKYIYQSYNDAAATQIRYTETTVNLQKSATNVATGTTFWWRVKAVDAAGNESAWSTLWKVTIDSVAPTAIINFPGVGPSATSFTVQFNEAVNKADAENANNYFLNNWKPEWSFSSLAGHATVSYNEATHLATVTFTDSAWYVSGEQQWGVKNIRDLAGNSIVPTTKYSTDPAGPTAPGAPTATTPTNDTTINWSWTASTDPGNYVSGVEKYRYKLMKGSDTIIAETDTTGLSAATVVPGDGTYVLHVWAIDVAGNVGSESTGTVVVDTTPPEVTVGPTYNASDNKIQPNVIVDGDPVSFAWTTSVPSSDVVISNTAALEPVFTVSNDGTYEFTLTAKDAAGNKTVKLFSFTYVTPVPVTINTETIPTIPEAAPFSSVTASTTPTSTNTSGSTTTLQSTDDDVTTKDVLGAQTKKDGEVLGAETAAVIASTTQGWKVLGILWYWWVLIFAAVAGVWWFLAARRKTQAQDV